MLIFAYFQHKKATKLNITDCFAYILASYNIFSKIIDVVTVLIAVIELILGRLIAVINQNN